MRFLASLLCVGLALAVAGCDPVTDRRMFSKGIGSDLYTADALAVAQEQDEYIDAICDQAGFVHPGKGRICSSGQFVTSATVWTQFVQAGMNDIDRRCDAYLVWLDNIRRAEAPNLKQIADAHAATQLILQATSAGVTPMALVAVAFGLAADTLTNINSRLILQVNHSTVQAVVLSRQRDYRKELLGDAKTKPRVIIDSRPAAIYALRNYMRLCMPMTIETEINNTIVAYERGGIDALKSERMITAMSVSQPVTAGQRQFGPYRPFAPAAPDIAPYFEEGLSQQEADFMLARLCLNPGDTKKYKKSDLALALVDLYEKSGVASDATPNGKLSRNERPEIVKQKTCGDAKNFFERVVYANKTSAGAIKTSVDELKELVALLNRSDAGGQVSGDTLTSLRAKISAVRGDPKVTEKLTFTLPENLKPWLADQVTPDLVEALDSLPARQ